MRCGRQEDDCSMDGNIDMKDTITKRREFIQKKAGCAFSFMIIHMLIFCHINGKGRASWVHKSYKAVP